MRLLAAVPSVVYGLIGILVIVPLVNNHFITQDEEIGRLVVQLDGTSILVGAMVLTVMMTPIMIAIVVDALQRVPRDWKDGAAALGVNRLRAMWTICVRAARPAIVAAAVLATARALGEAIMLAMVTGSIGFAPNPLDGCSSSSSRPIRWRRRSSNHGGTLGPAVPADDLRVRGGAARLGLFLSLSGWDAKRPLRRYGLSAR